VIPFQVAGFTATDMPREIETEKKSRNRQHDNCPDHPHRHGVRPEYLRLSVAKDTQNLEFDRECSDYHCGHQDNRDCSHREYL
jgi:hypothetical protein